MSTRLFLGLMFVLSFWLAGSVLGEQSAVSENTALTRSEVLSRLDSEDASTLVVAMNDVVRIKANAAIPRLKSLLGSGNDYVRLKAACALLELGGGGGLPVVRSRLASTNTWDALQAAVALAAYGDADGVVFARKHLADQNKLLRKHAIEAVSHSKDRREAIAALQEGLRDPERAVRVHVMTLIEQLETLERFKLLLVAVENSDEIVRGEAVAGFLSVGTSDAIPPLLAAQSDSSQWVFSRATAALVKLTGEELTSLPVSADSQGEVVAAWRAWWEANRDRYPPGSKASRSEAQH